MVAFYRRKGRLYYHERSFILSRVPWPVCSGEAWGPEIPVSRRRLHPALGEVTPAPVLEVLFDHCPVSFSWEKFGPASLWVGSTGACQSSPRRRWSLLTATPASSFPDSTFLNPCEPVSSSPWFPRLHEQHPQGWSLPIRNLPSVLRFSPA